MEASQKVVGKFSLYTVKLIEQMNETTKQVLSDREMTEVCGFDTSVNGAGYGYLQSAMRHVLREHRKHWVRVRNEGCIKLLGPGETMDNVQQDQKHVRKTAKRSLVKLNVVDINQLSDEAKKEYLAKASQMGTILLVADNKTRKALADMNGPKPLDFGRLLEGFKNARI